MTLKEMQVDAYNNLCNYKIVNEINHYRGG